MFRQFTILLLSSVIALLTTLAQAETLNVRLLMSDSTPPYQQFSAALNQALAASKADVTVIGSQAGTNPQSGEGAHADLVIAVGTKAMELAIAKFDAPVLGVMIPRMGYEALLEKWSSQKRSQSTSAIYLDQPWSRQLNFIQAALPKHSIVGMLYSPNTSIVLPRLPQGMSINAKSVRSAESLFASLEHILESSDVLLVVPDSEIYSSNNLRNILLTSYRYKVPLIGISQAYVNAGALGAIFSTPEQLAGQTAEAIVSFARSRRLPEPQYPASFSITLNQQVARSLGIVLDSPEAIRERMDKAGEGKR
ncbi:MAG TPA: ABC transporter substrate binding protein [Gallionella sp.]|nr:ABC transporter substrate binding protein [Gallionella sp.]